MRFLGSAEFIATRDEVWPFLVDPSRIGPCSPFPIERVDDGRYVANARVGSGLFSTSVRVAIDVTDVAEGRHSRIAARGGASGMTAEGSITFDLGPGSMDGTTRVEWELEINLSGAFASQASRVVEERAPAALEQLLTCIHRQVEG